MWARLTGIAILAPVREQSQDSERLFVC